MSQTTSQTCAYEYTVRRGDSFYLIAHRLGVPLKDLLEANSDINPARLMVGDVLCIPGAAAETPDTNITAPTTPDVSDTTTNDALDTPAADMNAPATPGGETPDISFCPEIDRYTVLQGETAADLVNTESREELARILRDYGEEPFAWQIAAGSWRQGRILPSKRPCSWQTSWPAPCPRRNAAKTRTLPAAPFRRCALQ